MQYNTYTYQETSEANEKMLNSFDTDFYHLTWVAGKQATIKGTWGAEGKVTKTVSRKKTKPLYLILIEAVGHAVNFKTH